MPLETASLFFVDDTPRPSLAALLRALEDQRLLADNHVDADGDALAAHAELGPLLGSGRAPLGAFLAALPTLSAQGTAPQPAYFYVRIVAPDALPAEWRAELLEKLGEQPEAPGELVHIHPYEIVIALDVFDIDHARTAAQLSTMKHRAHPHLPPSLRTIDTDGEPVQARAGFELRCPPEMVGVLSFVLEKAGLLANRLVLVRVLD